MSAWNLKEAPAIGRRLSAIGRRLPAIGRRLSAFLTCRPLRRRELRKQIGPEVIEVIKKQRLYFLVQGSMFNKFSTKGIRMKGALEHDDRVPSLATVGVRARIGDRTIYQLFFVNFKLFDRISNWE